MFVILETIPFDPGLNNQLSPLLQQAAQDEFGSKLERFGVGRSWRPFTGLIVLRAEQTDTDAETH